MQFQKTTMKGKGIFKYLFLTYLLTFAASARGAETIGTDGNRNELRLGVGDMLFETLIWHNQIHKSYIGTPDGSIFTEDNHYSYTPHLSLEYSYHLLPWMSLGFIADFQNTAWRRERYDNTDILTGYSNENFYNLSLLPVVRFNYMRHPHAILYSALALGVDINGGSEKDGFGHYTACGFAADIRLIGIRCGSGQWWGFAELGALGALKHTSVIYMAGSELFKVGVSYNF